MKKLLILNFFIFLLIISSSQSVNGQLTTVDNTSKVPKYIFSTTLAQQEEELKSNPLMLRLIESRKKLSGDKKIKVPDFVL